MFHQGITSPERCYSTNKFITMKHYFSLLFLAFWLLLLVPTEGQNPVPPPARPISEWITLINRDAKLSQITKLLGKPDRVKGVDGKLLLFWDAQVDDGSKRGTTLALIVTEVRNEMVIIAIYDPTSGAILKFDWSK